VFNAFLTISGAGVVSAVLYSSLPEVTKTVTLLVFGIWFIGIAVWTGYIAKTDPRSLSYGPNEYLQESKLAHDRHMAALRLTNKQAAQ
jgi:hypothetical protein